MAYYTVIKISELLVEQQCECILKELHEMEAAGEGECPPKDVHTQIPVIYEYVTLIGKGDFAL
jgi:hypothetical protein